jgi:hypothetical protein
MSTRQTYRFVIYYKDKRRTPVSFSGSNFFTFADFTEYLKATDQLWKLQEHSRIKVKRGSEKSYW